MLLIAPPPQPYDIWRDPVWQFIGVLAAILLGAAGLIVAIRANRQQNKRKELTYQTVFDTPLVSVDKALKSEVEIRFRGSVVEDVSLVSIKVWNSGSLAVRREDCVEPITFELAGRTVLSFGVNSEPTGVIKPENLNDFLKLEPNYLKLSPVLLNPADTITLNMIVSGQGKIRGAARIIDGKLIEFDPANQPITYNLRAILVPFLLSAIVYSGILLYAFDTNLANIKFYPFSILLILLSSIISTLCFVILPQISKVVKRGLRIRW